MESDQCFLSHAFAVLTVDQSVGHGGGRLNDRNRIATFIEKLTGCL